MSLQPATPVDGTLRVSGAGDAAAVAEPRHDRGTCPAVSVVIATHRRPEMLQDAIDGVLAQEYSGAIEVVVVYDRCEPDPAIERPDPQRRVRVMRNCRTPGLAGARNTGTLAASHGLVAYCDDDDVWLAGKLATQVAVLACRPECDVVLSGIVIHHGARRIVRVPPGDTLEFRTLLRRRVTEAHPSSVLARRGALIARIGLVDEEIPGSYGEDYEWLLRAAEQGPVALVAQPLVAVRWGATTYFQDRWETMAEAIAYLLAKRPEFRSEPKGCARLYGRRAFALAAAGHRRAAVALALQAIRLNWRDRRAYLALAVASRIVSASFLTRLFNARGAGVV